MSVDIYNYYLCLFFYSNIILAFLTRFGDNLYGTSVASVKEVAEKVSFEDFNTQIIRI
jgi:hypothetical protein